MHDTKPTPPRRETKCGRTPHTTPQTPQHTETTENSGHSPDVLTRTREGDELLSLPWMAVFLDVFATTANVHMACEGAGVSRQRAYVLRASDVVFGAKWADLQGKWADALKSKALEVALKGDARMLEFLLRNLNPEEFSDRVELRGTVDVAMRHSVLPDGVEAREIDPAKRHELAARLLGLGAGEAPIDADAVDDASETPS